jgi:hypothetical protein
MLYMLCFDIVTYFMLWLFVDNKVYEVILTENMLFLQILNSHLSNFSLILPKTLVKPVVNKHDLEITLHIVFIPLIYINFCHQVLWCRSRRDLVTLDISYNNMVVSLLMYKVDHDVT